MPVTSKGRFLKYTARLAGSLTPLSGVVTRITLERVTSKGGKPYALFKFEAAGKLDPEEADRAGAYARQFREIVNAAEMVPEMEGQAEVRRSGLIRVRTAEQNTITPVGECKAFSSGLCNETQ